MDNQVFYDVFLNKDKIATVGPSALKQLHISFGVTDGSAIVKASGISEQEPEMLFINWLEQCVEFGDSFSVSPSQENVATKPRHTKKLKRGMDKTTEEDSLCDFCNCSEDEVGQLIRLGGSPQICNTCIKLCVDAMNAND
jgi:hypothetical protein